MANRYWRGGAGTWDGTSTTNWSDTSGGAGGFSVPTSADDVFFNAGSAGANYSVLISAGAVCKNLSIAGPSTGTFTLSNSSSPLDIYGGLSVAASGVTWSYSSGVITFRSTASGNQITLNGKTLLNNIAFDGVNGEWILQDNFAISTNRGLTLTNGGLNLNNNTASCGQFSSNNGNTRSIVFGTGKIICANNSTTVINFANSTGFTYTGSGVFEFNYSGATGTRTFAFGSQAGEANYPNVKIIAGTDIVTNTVAYYVKNLNFTGFSGTWNSGSTIFTYGDLIISATQTVSASASSLFFSKTSGTQAITTAGKTLDRPLAFNGIGGTFAFQDALTQGSTRAFTVTNGTVQLKASVTSAVGAFATSGTNQKYLQSTLAGTQATLSQASGTVDASYLTIKDINATGGATFNAYLNQSNVNAGNNVGWDFNISPVAGGTEYTYALRSFTQPRRF